ncbi:MAG TPA: hypothetical protein VFA42_01135 [Gaiellaceae bacterium]|jgi:hypothetical protein|nr:hypothetical protein [Gaiellaceae bacterium]
MTPTRRDLNLARIRNWTGAIAGASLVATGLFAGLAATKGAVTKTVVVTKTKVIRAAAKKTSTAATASSAKTTAVTPPTTTVTVTRSAPIATSGGS